MRPASLRLLSAFVLLASPHPAQATPPPLWALTRSLPTVPPRPGPAPILAGPLSPGAQCRTAIAAAERGAGIPPHLMAAIGLVESGRPDSSGRLDPWPWSIDAEGVDHVYRTKAEAIAAVRALQASGIRSIDVGCMQVNLFYHPGAFASLDDAFDPVRNAAYAAQFLSALRAQTGSWAAATAAYHSATPALGADYQRRVMAALPQELDGGARLLPGAAAPGPFMLGNGASHARVIPLAAGATGRGLAAYRAAPVPVAKIAGARIVGLR